MSLEKLLKRNNDGVKLLHSGCYEAAMATFRDALSRLKSLSQKEILHFPLVVEMHLIPNAILRSGHYVYQNALIAHVYVETVECDKTELNSQENQKVSFSPVEVILYNLSLGLHFAITGAQVRSKKNCRKVLAMYERSLRTLKIQPLSKKTAMTEKHPPRDVIFLGILNNIGVLNYELNNYRRARFCFDVLKSLMNRLSLSVLGEETHKAMLTNVWFLEKPQAAEAAWTCRWINILIPIHSNNLFKFNHGNVKEIIVLETTCKSHDAHCQSLISPLCLKNKVDEIVLFIVITGCGEAFWWFHLMVSSSKKKEATVPSAYSELAAPTCSEWRAAMFDGKKWNCDTIFNFRSKPGF